MVSSEFPSLAEVAAQHRWISKSTVTRAIAGCTCGWQKEIATTHKSGIRLQGEHLEAVWLEACTIRTAEQLDALPTGSIVLTASPRLIPSTCIWIRDTSDDHGHWWRYRDDDSFRGDDVLYENPEVALLLHHPDWAKP